jgi:hypothetical protein
VDQVVARYSGREAAWPEDKPDSIREFILQHTSAFPWHLDAIEDRLQERGYRMRGVETGDQRVGDMRLDGRRVSGIRLLVPQRDEVYHAEGRRRPEGSRYHPADRYSVSGSKELD